MMCVMPNQYKAHNKSYVRKLVPNPVADFEGTPPCAQQDADMWFPDNDSGSSWRDAVVICKTCPLQAECLEYALYTNVQGIWGGTTMPQRRSWRRTHKVEAMPIDAIHFIRDFFETPEEREARMDKAAC